MSLARAFFQAGASAVVASLWELDDRDALRFFTEFYEELSGGRELREALAAVQRRWARQGRDIGTWGAVVVLGDGRLAPVES